MSSADYSPPKPLEEVVREKRAYRRELHTVNVGAGRCSGKAALLRRFCCPLCLLALWPCHADAPCAGQMRSHRDQLCDLPGQTWRLLLHRQQVSGRVSVLCLLCM